MNSSCRAPALSAMAFQPLVVGTVTRILTSPLASRTGRMTPGITDRMAGFCLSRRSSTSRTPSRMLCSTLSFPWTFRNRITHLLKTLVVLNVDAERPVFIAQRYGGPFSAEVPLHPNNLLIGDRKICDVGDRDVGRYLLLHRQPGLRNDGDVGELRIDLDMADSEEFLQTPGVGGDGLREKRIAAGSEETAVDVIHGLRRGQRTCGGGSAAHGQQRDDVGSLERRIGTVREVQFVDRAREADVHRDAAHLRGEIHVNVGLNFG